MTAKNELILETGETGDNEMNRDLNNRIGRMLSALNYGESKKNLSKKRGYVARFSLG